MGVLYTRCTHCDTLFELTLEELNAASGVVRCGVCRETFNAREHLSEEPLRAADLEEDPGPPVLHHTAGRSSDPAAADGTTAGTGVVPLEEGHAADDADRGRADAGAGGEDGGTVEAVPDELLAAAGEAPAEGASAEDTVAPPGHAPAHGTPPPGDAPPAAEDLQASDRRPRQGLPAEQVGGAAPGEAAPEEADAALSPAAVGGAAAGEAPAREGTAGADGPADDAPDDALASLLSGRRHTRGWRYTAAWSGASLLLILALAAQGVIHWRNELLQIPRVGEVLVQANEALGSPLSLEYDPARYVFLQRPRLVEAPAASGAQSPGQGAEGTPENLATGPAAGDVEAAERITLQVTARIANRAAVPQPAPLLQLVIEDRWGRPVAARTLTPRHYLPAASRGGGAPMLGPGEGVGIDVTLRSRRRAEAFVMDICLRRRDGSLNCAGS